MQGGPHRPGPGSAAKASRARARRAVRTPTAVRRLLRRPGIGVGASGSPQATAPLTMTRFHRAMSASTRARQLCPTPSASPAAAFRDGLDVPVAPPRRGPGRVARHRARAGRHDDGSIGGDAGRPPCRRRTRCAPAKAPTAAPRRDTVGQPSARPIRSRIQEAMPGRRRRGPPRGSAPDGAPGEGSRSDGAPECRVGTMAWRRGGPAPPADRRTGGPQGSAPRVRGFSLARARGGCGTRARKRARRAGGGGGAGCPARGGQDRRRGGRRAVVRHGTGRLRRLEGLRRPADRQRPPMGGALPRPTAGPGDRGALLSDRWPGRSPPAPGPAPRAGRSGALGATSSSRRRCRPSAGAAGLATDAAAGTDRRTAVDAVLAAPWAASTSSTRSGSGRARPRSTRAIRAGSRWTARRCRSACRRTGPRPRPDADCWQNRKARRGPRGPTQRGPADGHRYEAGASRMRSVSTPGRAR